MSIFFCCFDKPAPEPPAAFSAIGTAQGGSQHIALGFGVETSHLQPSPFSPAGKVAAQALVHLATPTSQEKATIELDMGNITLEPTASPTAAPDVERYTTSFTVGIHNSAAAALHSKDSAANGEAADSVDLAETTSICFLHSSTTNRESATTEKTLPSKDNAGNGGSAGSAAFSEIASARFLHSSAVNGESAHSPLSFLAARQPQITTEGLAKSSGAAGSTTPSTLSTSLMKPPSSTLIPISYSRAMVFTKPPSAAAAEASTPNIFLVIENDDDDREDDAHTVAPKTPPWTPLPPPMKAAPTLGNHVVLTPYLAAERDEDSRRPLPLPPAVFQGSPYMHYVGKDE